MANPLHPATGIEGVRALVESDAPAYRQLMLHAYQQAADAFTSTAEEREAEPLSWWVQRIADPRGASAAFGAFQAGRLVGTVAVEFNAKPKTRHKALVIGMFVEADCRGLGLGRQLLEAAIACARSRAGVRVLTLTVTQGNDPAIGLYRAFGFDAFGAEPMAILTPSGYRAKVHMWLDLASEARPGPDSM
jgi:GNAT superfamily N-acetyltransferase